MARPILLSRKGLVPGGDVAAGQALNNIQPGLLEAGALCVVTSNNAIYEWRPGSTDAESLPKVVAPASGAASGRWHQSVSSADAAATYNIRDYEYLVVGGDWTAAIQAAEAAAAAAGAFVTYPPGTYLVTAPVVVNAVLDPGAAFSTSGSGAVSGSIRYAQAPTSEAGQIAVFTGAAWESRGVRGNQTSVASGTGTTALKLSGDVTSLTLSDVLGANERNQITIRVQVQDDDGSDAWTDEFVLNVQRDGSGNVRLTDGAGNESGALAATAQIANLTSPDSFYSYDVDASVAGDTLTLSLHQHASLTRVTKTETWWAVARDWS